MPSRTSHQNISALTALIFAFPVLAQQGGPYTINQYTYQGCYASAADMKNQGSFQFQSWGHCQEACGKNQNLAVMALSKGSDCWCGSTIPANSTKVSDDECNTKCQGFGPNMCGGNNAWTVFLTGTDSDFNVAASGMSSSPGAVQTSNGGSTPTAGPSTITKAGETIVVTASSQATVGSSNGNKSDSSSPNKAGIAAGVVGGVVGVAALAAALFFFLRYKKRQQVEAEYRRNAAINNFVQPGKAASEGSGSLNDSRLDPSIMAHRRQSDGSIADERDFSRRILQVRNPDGA